MIILISFIIIKVTDRMKVTQKTKDSVLKLRQRIFWNPVIRFSYLNYLQWNLMTLAAFTVLIGTD